MSPCHHIVTGLNYTYDCLKCLYHEDSADHGDSPYHGETVLHGKRAYNKYFKRSGIYIYFFNILQSIRDKDSHFEGDFYVLI